jgi:L-asparagine transporter-like permease
MISPKENNILEELRIYRILVYIVIAIGVLFAFMELSEFYNVAVAKHGRSYPFGTEGAWNYRSESTYWTSCLITGILYLAAITASLYGVTKRNPIWAFSGASVIIFLVIIMLGTAASTN